MSETIMNINGQTGLNSAATKPLESDPDEKPAFVPGQPIKMSIWVNKDSKFKGSTVATSVTKNEE